MVEAIGCPEMKAHSRQEWANVGNVIPPAIDRESGPVEGEQADLARN